MTISVLIPTRGRRRLLHATVTALEHLALSESITFCVGVDDDDVESSVGLSDLPYTKMVTFNSSVVTNGERYNILAKACPGDIYLLWCDDVFPLLHGWDQALVQMHRIDPVVGIHCENERGFAYRSITQKWLSAVGYVDPEIFPFWGNDAWMSEMARLVLNQEAPIQKQFSCGGKRGSTQGYRELDFWWGVYYALREQRLRHAWNVAQQFGLAGDDFNKFLESRAFWIADGIKCDKHRRTFIAEAEANYGDKSPPSPRYLIAKERALKLMAERGLEPWQELNVC